MAREAIKIEVPKESLPLTEVLSQSGFESAHRKLKSKYQEDNKMMFVPPMLIKRAR